MKSEVFQQLFDHGTSRQEGDGGATELRFRMLRRKGADFMLLPLDNQLAVRALTLYAPQNMIARVATALLRYSLKLGLPVPLKEVELQIQKSSPLIEFFTDALNLSGLGATDFAVIAGNPKDAARRYVFLLFDTLHRPAMVVKVGLGKEGSATVANESRFLESYASEDGMIPEPQGNWLAEDFAAFALNYQPGSAPPIYDEDGLSICLAKWVDDRKTVRVGELPVWSRLSEACADIDGFAQLAETVKDAEVSPVIYHGDFAPWNVKVRPGRDRAWVVLDWERGEPEGPPGWDWLHYVVQTGVLVEQLSEKGLRAKLLHTMDSQRFCVYAAKTGIEPIKLELALLYLLYSTEVLGHAAGSERVLSLYEHMVEERARGIDRNRRDYHTFWAARQQRASWLKSNLVYRPGAQLASIGCRHRVPAVAFPLAGLLLAVAGTWIVLNTATGAGWVALGLCCVLFLSNCLIGAEGMLARATRTVTRFGNGLDRAAGLGSFLAVTGMLAWSSGSDQARWLPDSWRPGVLAAAMLAATAVYSLRLYVDLREFERDGLRIGGSMSWPTDAALRLFLLSTAWALGAFWDFLGVYTLLLVVTLISEWLDFRAGRWSSEGSGKIRRIASSGKRMFAQQMRRVIFLKVLFSRKWAQMFGLKKPWVRPGVERVTVPEKVDVVYLWKDESDAAWVERREQFLQMIGKGSGYNRIDRGSRATKSSLNRLKYSMRSIDKYFDSLGKIFLVTDHQRPSWLKSDDPRVQVVDIDEIITDSLYLPSYNSQAIESYFYQIPGLSEFFVYLNDDFFLNCPVGAKDFFTDDGRIRVRLGRAVAARGIPSVREEGDTSAQKNANLVLDRHFRKEPRLTVMHRPYAHRKSLLARAAEEFPEEFHLTRRSHFRSIEMFALHSFLVPYWAYYNGEAELVPPQLFRKDMFYWSNDRNHNDEVLERIMATDQISFCIQAELSIQLTEGSVESYRCAMEEVFPDKSSFEI